MNSQDIDRIPFVDIRCYALLSPLPPSTLIIYHDSGIVQNFVHGTNERIPVTSEQRPLKYGMFHKFGNFCLECDVGQVFENTKPNSTSTKASNFSLKFSMSSLEHVILHVCPMMGANIEH